CVCGSEVSIYTSKACHGRPFYLCETKKYWVEESLLEESEIYNMKGEVDCLKKLIDDLIEDAFDQV
ncbi:hypothetical protein HID58_048370, partial [Brassica napus]